MQVLTFTTSDACEAALELIHAYLIERAQDAGYSVIVDAENTKIVSKTVEGLDAPSACGTICWDIPHKADTIERWFIASPYARYPALEELVGLQATTLPADWVIQVTE